MLVTSAAIPALCSVDADSANAFTAAGNPTTKQWTPTYTPTTSDLVAVAVLQTNVVNTGMAVNFQWGSAAGPAFAQQLFFGAQGAAKRGLVWVGTLRGVALTAASPYYSTPKASGFSDIILWLVSLKNWGGGVGITTGTQTNNVAGTTSVAVTFTPATGGSLLLGAGGAFNDLSQPYTVTGATKRNDVVSGAGGAGAEVDSSACLFAKQVVTPASTTVTVASATADANWCLGMVELY